jgi:hypothetical protein
MGLQKDLYLSPNQYYNALLVFCKCHITFAVSEISLD